MTARKPKVGAAPSAAPITAQDTTMGAPVAETTPPTDDQADVLADPDLFAEPEVTDLAPEPEAALASDADVLAEGLAGDGLLRVAATYFTWRDADGNSHRTAHGEVVTDAPAEDVARGLALGVLTLH